MAGKLELGLELSTREGRLGGGRTAGWRELREMAQLAEAVGFDTLFLEDHLLYRRWAGRESMASMAEGDGVGFWDCWTLIAPLFEATERVTIGPFVAAVSFRNPALIAKMVSTLDEVGQGRFIMGLGAGWCEPEYEAFGFPFDHLAGRFEEALSIILPLVREGHVDFRGKYYTARDCEIRPRGPSPKGPPLWIGARGPRMLRLVARHADAFNTYGHRTPEQASPRFADLEAACRDVGRDPATLRRTNASYVALPGAAEERSEAPANAITGSPEEIAARLLAFRSLGVDHQTVMLHPGDIRGVERFAPVIEALRKMESAEPAAG